MRSGTEVVWNGRMREWHGGCMGWHACGSGTEVVWDGHMGMHAEWHKGRMGHAQTAGRRWYWPRQLMLAP